MKKPVSAADIGYIRYVTCREVQSEHPVACMRTFIPVYINDMKHKDRSGIHYIFVLSFPFIFRSFALL